MEKILVLQLDLIKISNESARNCWCPKHRCCYNKLLKQETAETKTNLSSDVGDPSEVLFDAPQGLVVGPALLAIYISILRIVNCSTEFCSYTGVVTPEIEKHMV